MIKRRTQLYDTDLLYLFSYDADLEMRRDEVGFVPGGVRVNIFARPDKTRMYNVAGEQSILGAKSLQGTVVAGMDAALIRNDDIGDLDVRLILRTDDGVTLFSYYKGLFPAGPRGFRRLISEKPKLGTEEEPVRAALYIMPRYETANEQYSWLGQYQCVGFGQATIVKSKIRTATFDVYAMDG